MCTTLTVYHCDQRDILSTHPKFKQKAGIQFLFIQFATRESDKKTSDEQKWTYNSLLLVYHGEKIVSENSKFREFMKGTTRIHDVSIGFMQRTVFKMKVPFRYLS